MRSEEGAVTRDWEPGDGLTCRYASRSPIPCGLPVKTRVIGFRTVRRGGTADVVKKEPLCALHAANSGAPANIVAAAKKAATERLIVAHHGEWQKYLDEATDGYVTRTLAAGTGGAS